MLSTKHLIAFTALATAAAAFPFHKRAECPNDNKGPRVNTCAFTLTPTNVEVKSEDIPLSLAYALYVPFYSGPFEDVNTVIGGFDTEHATHHDNGTIEGTGTYCLRTDDPVEEVGEWIESWEGTTLHGPNVYGTDWEVDSVKCTREE
jgi:hypothetical protein